MIKGEKLNECENGCFGESDEFCGYDFCIGWGYIFEVWYVVVGKVFIECIEDVLLVFVGGSCWFCGCFLELFEEVLFLGKGCGVDYYIYWLMLLYCWLGKWVLLIFWLCFVLIGLWKILGYCGG